MPRLVEPSPPHLELAPPLVEVASSKLSLAVKVIAAPSGRILTQQTLHFPPDAEFEGLSASARVDMGTRTASIRISVRRSEELGILIRQLSLDEAHVLLAQLPPWLWRSKMADMESCQTLPFRVGGR